MGKGHLCPHAPIRISWSAKPKHGAFLRYIAPLRRRARNERCVPLRRNPPERTWHRRATRPRHGSWIQFLHWLVMCIHMYIYIYPNPIYIYIYNTYYPLSSQLYPRGFNDLKQEPQHQHMVSSRLRHHHSSNLAPGKRGAWTGPSASPFSKCFPRVSRWKKTAARLNELEHHEKSLRTPYGCHEI